MRTAKQNALLVAATALVASGCSAASVAATVDTASIEDASVLGLAGQSPDEGRVDGEGFRQSLTFLVLQSALLAAAQEDFGIPDVSTDEGREAFLATATDRELEAISAEVAAGVDQGREQTAVEDFVVTQVAIRTLVREALVSDDAIVEAAWNTDPDALITVCASHILVDTEAEAEVVIGRIEAGESFADVASDVSLDTQSPGGALPCPTHAYTFVESVADAVSTIEVGEISDPVESQFGFHVLLVESRDQPASLDELKTDPARWIPVQLVDAEYSAWLDDAVGRADISVRSQIGGWSPQLNLVVPPPASP